MGLSVSSTLNLNFAPKYNKKCLSTAHYHLGKKRSITDTKVKHSWKFNHYKQTISLMQIPLSDTASSHVLQKWRILS